MTVPSAVFPPIDGAVARPVGGGLPWEDSGGGKPPAPVNVTPPTVSGTVLSSQTLTTTNGAWSGAVTSYEYDWTRDLVSQGDNTATRICPAGDCGPTMRSRVRAIGPGGTSAWVDSSNSLVYTPVNHTGIRCWLRADLGVTEGASDDVISWDDQSGIGNVFTDGGVGTRRPTRVDAVLNGHQIIRFDGRTDWLSDATFSWGGVTNPTVVMAVYKQGTLVNGDVIYAYGAGNRPAQTMLTGNLVRYYASTGGAIDGTTTHGGAFKTIWGAWDGANAYTGTGATQEATAANAGSSQADGGVFALGGSSTGGALAAMDLAEIVVLRTAPSSVHWESFASYAAYRYGVTG